MKFIVITVAALSFVLPGSAAQATDGLPPIYVGTFVPAQAPSTKGGGPLHALTSRMHTRKVDANSASLPAALVRALSAQAATVQRLPDDSMLPASGWIVRGVFYSLDTAHRLIALPFLNGNGDKMPDVEVTVTIADAAKDPSKPFAVIGEDAVLRGQGSPAAWNPYVVAARFAIHKVEGDRSIEALANEIAVKILANRTKLARHDASQP